LFTKANTFAPHQTLLLNIISFSFFVYLNYLHGDWLLSGVPQYIHGVQKQPIMFKEFNFMS
jgi:hypothetical protein